jgi:GWxTD domain-containing protein
MNRPPAGTRLLGLGLALLLFAAGARAAGEKPSPELARWLEDVSPILTKIERTVFLKLQTNADRAKFVRFFWRMRDPLPDTAANEFQKEYEDRVLFADRNFGHFSPKRGSQTDRGFYYLLLGPPLERTFFTTQSFIWPMELWFYKGAEEYGLPGYFYLVFYQPEGLGDFRLYSPTVEGPEKLVVPALGNAQQLTRANALTTLRDVSPELASAALSYLPGEVPMDMASFSSDSIIATVRGLPEKKFSSTYARSYLAFKDFVETDYTDSFIASAFQLKVFREGGQAFLHWAIEPDKMNFASRDDVIYASFEFILRLEDGRGALVHERTEEIPLKLTAEQYRDNARRRFAFQDLLAVAPGEYKALFLLKNKTAKDFSSFEARIAVPPAETSARPGLGTPLLFYARSAVPEAQKNNLKAFAIGGQHYLVGARNEFPPSSTLGVFVQAANVAALVPAGRPSFTLDIVSLDTNESAGTFPLENVVPDPKDAAILLVSGEIPLKDVRPGYYRAEVSLRSQDGRILLAEKENFVVLSQPAPVIPWAYARLHGAYPGPEHLKVLGSQHFLKGDYAKARDDLERALEFREDASARLLLAKALYGMGLFRESLAHAVPLYERVPDRESAKVIALDHAGLKDWDAALVYLEKLMAEATEIPVLNLAAECHLALDRPERALPLLQKSLALVPDQPAVRALEEQARKRIELR